MKLSFLAFFSVCLFTISCSSSKTITLSNGKKLDKAMLGNWNGDYRSPNGRSQKSWLTERKEDGTLVKSYSEAVKNKKAKYQRKGNWWTENGHYFEQTTTENGLETDEFEYTINQNEIGFKLLTPHPEEDLLPRIYKEVKTAETE